MVFAESKLLWLSLIAIMLTGFGIILVVMGTSMIFQTIVADEKRGRVMSFFTVAFPRHDSAWQPSPRNARPRDRREPHALYRRRVLRGRRGSAVASNCRYCARASARSTCASA